MKKSAVLKILKQLRALGFPLAVSWFLACCGPVNSKPADASSTNVGVQVMTKGAPQQAVELSSQRQFVVTIQLLPPKATSAPTSSPADVSLVGKSDATKIQAQLGDNQYLIHVRHGADLSPLSDELMLTVQYEHVTKIKMLYQAKVAVQADGSFLADIPFAKGGTWNIHVHVTDGDLDDEAVFDVKL